MGLPPLAPPPLSFALTVAPPAQGVLTKLRPPTGSFVAVRNDSYRAQGFATPAGSAWQFNSVTLSLAMANNTSGNFVVGVFSDAAGDPASLVGGWLTGSSDPETAGDYVYTNASLT